jgi:hypothetical protein
MQRDRPSAPVCGRFFVRAGWAKGLLGGTKQNRGPLPDDALQIVMRSADEEDRTAAYAAPQTLEVNLIERWPAIKPPSGEPQKKRPCACGLEVIESDVEYADIHRHFTTNSTIFSMNIPSEALARASPVKRLDLVSTRGI